MSNYINANSAVIPDMYMGEDGLLHCSVCGKPKEAFYPEKFVDLFGVRKHPVQCYCDSEKVKKYEQDLRDREHRFKVAALKRDCFTSPGHENVSFTESNGSNKKTRYAQAYVENWSKVKEENCSLIFWGDVGTGKTYHAICIANALMEREVAVKMIQFSRIMAMGFQEQTAFIDSLNQYGLLIIDDFGAERSTEYGLEMVHRVLDARYEIQKPMIVTTNLTIDEMTHPIDTEHKRIYDRLAKCVPICFSGDSKRESDNQDKVQRFQTLIRDSLLECGGD